MLNVYLTIIFRPQYDNTEFDQINSGWINQQLDDSVIRVALKWSLFDIYRFFSVLSNKKTVSNTISSVLCMNSVPTWQKKAPTWHAAARITWLHSNASRDSIATNHVINNKDVWVSRQDKELWIISADLLWEC